MSHADTIKRLEATARGLRRNVENAKFGGETTMVRVKSPDLLLADLDEAAAAIARLTKERDEAQAMFDECAIARDASGFLGTVPECIAHWEASATKNEKRVRQVEDALQALLAVGILNPTGSATVAAAVASARAALDARASQESER